MSKEIYLEPNFLEIFTSLDSIFIPEKRKTLKLTV